jgi:hypothetical protein
MTRLGRQGVMLSVEVVVEEDGFAGDGQEEIEDAIGALDGEVVYAEGGVGCGEEG